MKALPFHFGYDPSSQTTTEGDTWRRAGREDEYQAFVYLWCALETIDYYSNYRDLPKEWERMHTQLERCAL